jgi:hypothetical protein
VLGAVRWTLPRRSVARRRSAATTGVAAARRGGREGLDIKGLTSIQRLGRRGGSRAPVSLAADDTYTVNREMQRGAKLFVKGVQTGVYCDELGEVCYRASSYKSFAFGEAS